MSQDTVLGLRARQNNVHHVEGCITSHDTCGILAQTCQERVCDHDDGDCFSRVCHAWARDDFVIAGNNDEPLALKEGASGYRLWVLCQCGSSLVILDTVRRNESVVPAHWNSRSAAYQWAKRHLGSQSSFHVWKTKEI